MPSTTQTFKFSVGQGVETGLGLDGRVRSLSVDQNGQIGYFIEYVDKQGQAHEVYAIEADLQNH